MLVYPWSYIVYLCDVNNLHWLAVFLYNLFEHLFF
jgi:hypothetical protein